MVSKEKHNARWDRYTTKNLLEICVKEISTSGKPGVSFKARRWEVVVDEFNKRANKNYNQKQLKNRLDNLKLDWTAWKQLLGKETGLGWNHETGTIDNSKYARFRYQGIEFCEELEIIFRGTVATSQHSWTLATGAPSEDSAIKTNPTILEEIAEYDEEETNPDEDACHMTTGDLTKGRRKLGDVRQGRPDRKGSGNQSSESIGAEFGEHHRPSSSPFDEFESRERTRGVNAASPFFLDRKPDPRVELSGAYWNQRGRRDPTLSPGISRTFLGHQQDKLGPEIP
ncbi:hypothetical protein K1719_041061 [Acacia pycnantha]|nr:hypothetical protein K1719_041061 [Acacia pycnantha]